MTSVKVTSEGFPQADKLLARLPVAVRGKAARSATRASARVVANQYRKNLPRTNENKTKHLADLVKVRVVEYEATGRTVAVAGTEWAGGQHAHLVEEGHDMWLWGRETTAKVEGKHYMLKAIEQTKPQAEAAFEKRLALEIKKVGG